ncbi:hypothetical protein GPX89_06925 [Nocardia sp. ET3-3]|uniref:Uncharacterized protein n=1 Tax=Nocardia terrae TaxID=2675851 RepID=A0A7K1USV5_9NOCA|nr:hypothetical protein [Nocardia terrae]MVU76978.1 hypothetical protein [Nocardia terrae]
MFRVFELLGLLAPAAGAALAVYYRRRLGGAFPYAVAAAVIALGGSAVALISERTLWLGGDAEGMSEHLEVGAALRNLLLIVAWVLLLVAIARHRRTADSEAGTAVRR